MLLSLSSKTHTCNSIEWTTYNGTSRYMITWFYTQWGSDNQDIDQTVNSLKTLHSWPSRTICGMSFVGTVRCRHNVVQYTMILYTALQWQGKTLHTFLPQQVRSAVSIVRIFGENWPRYSRTTLYIRENDHILSEASIGLWVLSLPSLVFVCVHVCLCESNISLSPG